MNNRIFKVELKFCLSGKMAAFSLKIMEAILFSFGEIKRSNVINFE